MVVQTWCFVRSKHNHPWVRVELRAERGALLRVSGLSYGSALASLARIRSALRAVGASWPNRALTIHVHPSCNTDECQLLDLPLALALLCVQGDIDAEFLNEIVSHGMLGLEGEIQSPLAPSSSLAKPMSSGMENKPSRVNFMVTPDDEPFSFPLPFQLTNHLKEVVQQWPRWREKFVSFPGKKCTPEREVPHAGLGWNMLDGEGQAKTWLCIAAKHRLPVLMAGPPGTGKSSLARAARELLGPTDRIPFLAPHPTGGAAGLLGSWRRGQPVPGAWALADRGVLFLDEFPEWPRPARESLRHIMDTGTLHLSRAEGSFNWSSNAWILAALNLCPCGQHDLGCVCSTSEKLKYRRKLSAPLLERFPVQLEVGQNPQECTRTWQECAAWVQAPLCKLPFEWSSQAEQTKAQICQRVFGSKRLQRHLVTLAEGHCEWSERRTVNELDVTAAYNVMWMNLNGWKS